MAAYSLALDTKKQSGSIPQVITARQGDIESVSMNGSITADGSLYDFTGLSVRFECLKPDNTWVRDISVTVNGSGSISYVFDSAVFGAVGMIRLAYFAIYNGETFVDSTGSFVIEVLPNAESEGSAPSETYVSDITQLIAELNTIISDATTTATQQQAQLDALIATYETGAFINQTQLEAAISALGIDNYLTVANASSTYVQVSGLTNLIYPVGSLYLSTVSTSPATLFGGTWSQISDRFLLAAGSTYSAGATGGEATHTLTSAEMPSHTHTGTTNSNGTHTHSTSGFAAAGSTGTSNYALTGTDLSKAARDTASDGAHTHGFTTGSAGTGGAHNNLPPYLAVYVWKRTA